RAPVRPSRPRSARQLRMTVFLHAIHNSRDPEERRRRVSKDATCRCSAGYCRRAMAALTMDDNHDGRKPRMICDVHAHYTPKNFSQFMGDRFASPTHLPIKRGMARHPFSDSPEDIEGRFQLMDEAGVEEYVLSPNHSAYLPDCSVCGTAV